MRKPPLSIIIILLLTHTLSCKEKDKPAPESSNIKKWERSVVNIECQQLRYSAEEINQVIETERAQNKFSTEQDEIIRRAELGRETNPVSGTAIYLTDKGKKYLVTAKHVIFDPQESSAAVQRLYKDISIRTPYEYYLKNKVNNSSIPSTGYGFADPFYLSDDATDIGILSLQASLTAFLIKTLDDDGYVPINVSDINASVTLNEGSSIAAIGYPDISKIGVFKKINDYQSNVVVLPVSTFGSIAMTHDRLPYFISDITVYPGNSGGPIIKENKLIGIVSGQVLIPADKRDANNEYYSTSLYSRGALAKVIKVKYILEGLRKLQEIESGNSFH